MEDFLEEVTGITYVTLLENNLCCTAIIWEMLSVPNPKSTDFFCLLSLFLLSIFPFLWDCMWTIDSSFSFQPFSWNHQHLNMLKSLLLKTKQMKSILSLKIPFLILCLPPLPFPLQPVLLQELPLLMSLLPHHLLLTKFKMPYDQASAC